MIARANEQCWHRTHAYLISLALVALCADAGNATYTIKLFVTQPANEFELAGDDDVSAALNGVDICLNNKSFR
jgi:hypothetical protein